MMRKLAPVEGQPDLVRDLNTGMILNINKDKIVRAKAAREQRQKDKEEIETLKSDVSEIKIMLQKLLENSNNG